MDKKNQVHESVVAHLRMASGQLSVFLEKVLPSLFDDWWNEAVIHSLSFHQQKRIEQRKITTLKELDLAGLLRVLDQNWYKISSSLNLSSESRHFVKELRTVRNRWAHAGTEGFLVDDIYRDVDTLQRFAGVISADNQFIEELKETKKILLKRDSLPQLEGNFGVSLVPPEKKNHESEFKPGQMVFIKSKPSSRGAVVEILPGQPASRVKVFIESSIETFYTSQLQSENPQEEKGETLLCDQFHAYLSALQIRYPVLSILYSLNAARIDFIPYQFRPVLRFIKSDRPRLLIADGVGVGKTIESGLILRELQARGEIRSVLIVCPRPLITEQKWEKEMRRFDERFLPLDGATLRHCINDMDLDGVWPEQYRKVIVPYSLFDEVLLHGSGSPRKRKYRKGLLDLDPPPRFDLVIVDEAHHIRNQDTFSHKAVTFFCNHAEAVLFLTATPIQLDSNDLFVLLNTLRPDLIIDQKSFAHMAEPNPYIHQAVSAMRSPKPRWQNLAMKSLEKAAATPWGQSLLQHNPDFKRVYSQLQKRDIPRDQRIKMISETEGMHTFAGVINRTRRRDIANFTLRKPHTVTVPFTPDQQDFHDELLKIQTEIFSRIHDDVNIKFMMTTIRRQAASCLFGLVPFLQDILNRHIDELSWEEMDNTGIPGDETVTPIRDQIENLLKTARSLDPKDPKLEALYGTIRQKQSLTNNKVMLFSSFRHTLSYLFSHLREYGFRVGMIHGGTPDEDRIALRSRFEKPKEEKDGLDLLLFSEIGCEGLDYQFCDCIINYDLPWNPMRVEQRIGRIDRNGQKSESVAIINMITPGTVDADIYNRCLRRIGVFNNALGGSEEILGEITREIRNIAENYQLSEEERKNKLQQLADNKIRVVQEQEKLEQKQAELFGILLPQEQMKREIADASSFWLSPVSIRRLVTLYLQGVCGKNQEFILGEKPLKTLRLSQESRSGLLRDFQNLPRQNTSAYREWEKWLKDERPHLSITFDSDCAIQNPKAAFIMPLHPLVKQASFSFDTKQRIRTHLKVVSSDVPPGQYDFAIYQWRFHGLKEDLVLKPVASDPVVTEHLDRLLEQAVDGEEAPTSGMAINGEETLDAWHFPLWKKAKTSHEQHIKELAEYRRESLSTSHKARITLIKEQLESATNEKIQKMRRSQLSAAEADYGRRIQDLDMAGEKADIHAGPVAYGVIHVVGEPSHAR